MKTNVTPDRIEQASETWLAVTEWAESRIESLRAKNDGPHDAVTTSHIRGQIAAIKQILALATPAPTDANEA